MYNNKFEIKIKEFESVSSVLYTQNIPTEPVDFENIGFIINTDENLSEESVSRIIRAITSSLEDHGFLSPESEPTLHVKVLQSDSYSLEIITW